MNEGIVVPVLPYTVFNFTGVTSTTGAETVIVADKIPIPPFCRIGLSLRQHRLALASGTNVQFSLRSINPSDMDGADFVASTVLGASASLNATGGTALLEFTTGNGFSLGLVVNGPHPMARLLITASNAGTAVGTIFGIFSADLILRTGS